MKMQKSVLFVKKNLKINIWEIKKYSKIRDGCHHINEYRGVLHISYVIWNIVYLKQFL